MNHDERLLRATLDATRRHIAEVWPVVSPTYEVQQGEVDAQTVIARSMTERDLSQHVVNLARMLGWRVARWPTWRATGTDPGVPDLVMVRPDARLNIVEQHSSLSPRRPRLIFAELKAQNGRVSGEQRAWLNALEDVAYESVDRHNVECYVWRPLDHLDGTIERVLRGEAE